MNVAMKIANLREELDSSNRVMEGLSNKNAELRTEVKELKAENKKLLYNFTINTAHKMKNFIPEKDIERAFNARMAYEKNCILKYDDPLGMRSSKAPRKGERMKDFALLYGVSQQAMKNILPEVEKAIEREKADLE